MTDKIGKILSKELHSSYELDDIIFYNLISGDKEETVALVAGLPVPLNLFNSYFFEAVFNGDGFYDDFSSNFFDEKISHPVLLEYWRQFDIPESSTISDTALVWHHINQVFNEAWNNLLDQHPIVSFPHDNEIDFYLNLIEQKINNKTTVTVNEYVCYSSYYEERLSEAKCNMTDIMCMMEKLDIFPSILFDILE